MAISKRTQPQPEAPKVEEEPKAPPPQLPPAIPGARPFTKTVGCYPHGTPRDQAQLMIDLIALVNEMRAVMVAAGIAQ
jgi:hypothetical protein